MMKMRGRAGQQISSAPRQRFDDEDVESVHLFDRPLDLRNAGHVQRQRRHAFVNVFGAWWVPAYALFAAPR
jgi:hypothetical protein